MSEHYIIDDKEHIYESAAEKHLMKKTVTLNGTYKGEDESGDINGYSEVTVNVEGGGSATLITKSVTQNGTYKAQDDSADGYSSVTVNVDAPQPTLITKSVTENGTYSAQSDSADGYSSVTVNVPSSGGSSLSYMISAKQYIPHETPATSNIDMSNLAFTTSSGRYVE